MKDGYQTDAGFGEKIKHLKSNIKWRSIRPADNPHRRHVWIQHTESVQYRWKNRKRIKTLLLQKCKHKWHLNGWLILHLTLKFTNNFTLTFHLCEHLISEEAPIKKSLNSAAARRRQADETQGEHKNDYFAVIVLLKRRVNTEKEEERESKSEEWWKTERES